VFRATFCSAANLGGQLAVLVDDRMTAHTEAFDIGFESLGAVGEAAAVTLT
jgi:hypothetical protein